MGGDAYPSPCTMASSDRSKPPVQSVPVKEQMNFPAKPIAPYIPDSKVLSDTWFYLCLSHILLQIYDSWHRRK